MLNQDTVREATRLTRAGQLVEATALLQRMLRGESVPEPCGSTTSAARARLEPPTIDVKATVVKERERRPPAQSSSTLPRPKSRARFDSKEFSTLGLRGPIRRAPPSALEIAPQGTKFIEGTFSNAAGSRTYKLFIPSRYQGQPLPLVDHASRLHSVGGRFRGWHPDELPGGRAELLRRLSGAAQRSQSGEMLELVSQGRPAAGRRRTFADRWHYSPDHA